jgi:hypothetical protein
MKSGKLEEVGEVSHYYSRIGVAVVELKKPLSVGDQILISGATTHFEQNVLSMQIEHKDVKKAKKGQSIGFKVDEKVRRNDVVYKMV